METKFNLESIRTEIGYIGRTQSFYFALICFIAFFSGAFTMMYAFTAADLNYRCYIDGCDKSDVEHVDYNSEWIKYAMPFDENTELPEKCFMYDIAANKSQNNCDGRDFNYKSIIKCNKFVFETNEKTILTEFNLTCKENKWKQTIPGTIHGTGKFLNALLIGYFSDRFGRKKLLIASTIFASTFAVLQTLSYNYWWFLVFTFFETGLGGGLYPTCFILSLEFVSPKHRTAVGSVLFSLAAMGTMYLGYAAMLVLNWKLIILLCYVPNFIAITYIWLLPESITWLQMKGRYQDIANILLRIIKWNKIKLSDEARDVLLFRRSDMLDNDTKSESDEKSRNAEIFPIRDVFRSRPMMLRILSLAFCWITNMFIFFGLSLISTSIGNNKFIGFIIASSMEILACILLTLISKRVGRRLIMCSALLIGGSTLLIYTFVSHIYWMRMALFMFGKLAITMSFCINFLYTSELVPTNLRQTLMGICAAFGRIGALIAPQTPLLEMVMKNLSIYLFAGLGLIGGLIALRFPETLNCKLPDTIEEALQIGKQKSNKSSVLL